MKIPKAMHNLYQIRIWIYIFVSNKLKMMKSTACSKMPLWKWILLFIIGFIVFFILYGFSQIAGSISHKVFYSCLGSVVSSCVLLAIYYLYIKVTEKRKADEINPSTAIRELGKGLAVGFGYFMLVVGTMAIFGCYKVVSVQFPWQNLLKVFCMFFAVGVGEEVIFRGIIHRMIDQRWNTTVALVISGLIFGFIHITNQGATVFSSIAIALEAGLMLGAAFNYSGNLWFPIGIHWAWNFTQGNILGFAVSGTDSGASVITPSINGPEILTGGAFGAEASVIAIFYGVIIAAFFIYKITQKNKAAEEITIAE